MADKIHINVYVARDAINICLHNSYTQLEELATVYDKIGDSDPAASQQVQFCMELVTDNIEKLLYYRSHFDSIRN